MNARGVNPLALIGASVVVALALLASVDWVSAGTVVVVELALLPLARPFTRATLLRAGSIALAAAFACLAIVVYGDTSGHVYFSWALARVSDGSIALGIATGLRVLALGLPALLLFSRIDATALADALTQSLRLPARFVFGALAAFRLLELAQDDWRDLGLARRARGVADSARGRRAVGQAFALFVLSLRRGTALATAMEARAFGSPAPRTYARRSTFGPRDWAVLAGGVALAAAAVVLSVVTGNWNAIL